MALSKHADLPVVAQIDATEHRVFHHDNRAYTPHGGADGESLRGHLAENSGGGDWSFKPHRDRAVGDKFPAHDWSDPAFRRSLWR